MQVLFGSTRSRSLCSHADADVTHYLLNDVPRVDWCSRCGACRHAGGAWKQPIARDIAPAFERSRKKRAACECGHARADHLRGVGCCVGVADDPENDNLCDCGVFRGDADEHPAEDLAIGVSTPDGLATAAFRATPDASPELRAAVFAASEDARRRLAALYPRRIRCACGDGTCMLCDDEGMVPEDPPPADQTAEDAERGRVLLLIEQRMTRLGPSREVELARKELAALAASDIMGEHRRTA